MTRIIGFSGAHGTGKTTTLDAIAARQNQRIVVDDYKASRSVLKELKCTLKDATSTPTIMRIYQDAVLDSKLYRDRFTLPNCMHRSAKVDFLVDRTPADIYAYTMLWVRKFSATITADEFDELESWQYMFIEKCKAGMAGYDLVIHFPISGIPFVDDGIRASHNDQTEIDWLISEFLVNVTTPIHTIKSITVEDRVDEILELLQ